MDQNPIYLNWNKAADIFEDSKTTFYRLVKEIEEQIRLGRYSKGAVIHDKKTLVSFYVYVDYKDKRRYLQDRLAAKKVEPFNVNDYTGCTPRYSVIGYLERR